MISFDYIFVTDGRPEAPPELTLPKPGPRHHDGWHCKALPRGSDEGPSFCADGFSVVSALWLARGAGLELRRSGEELFAVEPDELLPVRV